MNDYNNIRRNTDPSTSHEAAKNVTESGVRQSQAGLLFDHVTSTPGSTAGWYARYTGMTMHQVSRRLADLKNAGKIQQGEPKMFHGRPQVTWWPGGDPEQQKPRAHCSTCYCFQEPVPDGQMEMTL